MSREDRPKSVSGTLQRAKRGSTKETPKPRAPLSHNTEDTDEIPTRTDGPRIRDEPMPLPPVFDFGRNTDEDDYTNVDDLDFFAETLRRKSEGESKKNAAPAARKVEAAPARKEEPAAAKPKSGSSQRLSTALGQIFRRRREEIGLTLPQLAKLAGIGETELQTMESGDQAYRMHYDHAVVLAKALGVPSSEMPGLRQKTNDKDSSIDDLARSLQKGLVVIFEGKGGERFGGEVERVAVTPQFTVCISDASLGAAFPAGTLLAFANDKQAVDGDVVLLRHRQSKLLALRRLQQHAWVGLQPWQPSYVVGAGDEWLPLGRMVLMIPRGR